MRMRSVIAFLLLLQWSQAQLIASDEATQAGGDQYLRAEKPPIDPNNPGGPPAASTPPIDPNNPGGPPVYSEVAASAELEDLPATASSVPGWGLLGVLLLLSALTIRILRLRSDRKAENTTREGEL